MYNVLSEEIELSPSMLAKFYQHQKLPQHTSLDKIEAWIEKENQKKDNSVIISSGRRNNFSSSSNILFDNSNNDGENDN